jgi:hypothetical protein
MPNTTSTLAQKLGHQVGTPEFSMRTSCTISKRPCATIAVPTSVGRKSAPIIATVENATTMISSHTKA